MSADDLSSDSLLFMAQTGVLFIMNQRQEAVRLILKCPVDSLIGHLIGRAHHHPQLRHDDEHNHEHLVLGQGSCGLVNQSDVL